MNRLHWALLSLLLVSGTAAANTTVGPLLDVDQPVPSGIVIIIDSWWDTYHWDHIVIDTGSAFNLRGLAYVTLPAAGTTDNALVTTIYGKALTSVGSGLDTTGFNALSPEMMPVSGETIIGTSGTEYSSFFASGPTALSDLPSLFSGDPDFDLSAFKGDPSSVVFAFRTSLPASELPVPEPLTMIALSMGVAGLGGYIRRRRMAAKEQSIIRLDFHG